MISKSELKFIRSLKIKKYRTAEKCFLVEGEKNVLEALGSDLVVTRVLVTSDFAATHENVLKNSDYEVVKEKELASVSALTTNTQALAVVKMMRQNSDNFQKVPVIFGLDGVQDPGNLGTIIRTLDWFGINHLVCSDDCVDLYNPKVISATMGSFSRVNVLHTDLSQFMSNFQGAIIGAEMSGSNIDSLRNLSEPLMLVMGSESHGIRSNIKELLQSSVSIQRFGKAESLNVGIATGIICHALATS